MGKEHPLRNTFTDTSRIPRRGLEGGRGARKPALAVARHVVPLGHDEEVAARSRGGEVRQRALQRLKRLRLRVDAARDDPTSQVRRREAR